MTDLTIPRDVAINARCDLLLGSLTLRDIADGQEIDRQYVRELSELLRHSRDELAQYVPTVPLPQGI